MKEASDFTGGADGYRRRLPRWLQACRTGNVLMCHPSRGTPSDPLANSPDLSQEVDLQADLGPAGYSRP